LILKRVQYQGLDTEKGSRKQKSPFKNNLWETIILLGEVICGKKIVDSKVELSPLSDTCHINTAY